MTTADLAKIYPDPLGGAYVSATDVWMRRTEFAQQLQASIGALSKAAGMLGGFAERRELADPGLASLVPLLRDARAATTTAVDAILERLDGDGDGA